MNETLQWSVEQLLDTWPGRRLRRAVRPFRAGWKEQQASEDKLYGAFIGDRRRVQRLGLAACGRERIALVVGYSEPAMVTLQTPWLWALRAAGFRVVVALPSSQGASARFYRDIGACELIDLELLEGRPDLAGASRLRADALTPGNLLQLMHREVPVGKFAASTLMRRKRSGVPSPTDAGVHAELDRAIAESVLAVDTACRLVDRVKPDLVCFYDRGYTPTGELFEVALASGARCTTLNAAHKSGCVVSKRYGPHNKHQHFGTPSAQTWAALQAMPWGEAEWQALRGELQSCYEGGLWYDEVGTQVGTRAFERDELVASLGLDPQRKVAVLFPHLFWDATFFWGRDLFDDYRDWFCQTLRAAADNPELNWVVKVHPANLVKDRRDGFHGEHSETIAIRETLGSLPGHIHVLDADSPVSTFSLFPLMDYCLTVRGTVGLEAGLFGKRVLTAGTGRYDGYGFTLDFNTAHGYLERLSRLQQTEAPGEDEIELARRYGHGLFLQRPVELKAIRFRYRQDESASLHTELSLDAETRPEDFGDVRTIAAWLANTDGNDDLLAAAHADDAVA